MSNLSPIQIAHVGSLVINGKVSLRSALDSNSQIKDFRSCGSGSTYMSGNSRYVHNEMMNMGSISTAGSYGVDGVSKVSAAVAAYVGNNNVDNSKAINLKYNASISAGIEYLKIEELTLLDLINAMSSSIKAKLNETLDKFNLLQGLIDDITGDFLEEITKDNDKIREVRKALGEWSTSVDEFLHAYGDGLVVAVHWGAFGFVDLTLSSKDSANTWKYGGSGSFEYADLGQSITVKAAYDGSQSDTNAEVEATVTSEFYGASIAPVINEWRKLVENKSFKEISEVQMLSKVPSLQVKSDLLPKPPEFVKPKPETKKDKGEGAKEDTLKEKLKKASTPKKVKELTTVKAFDKQKEEGIELQEFAKSAAEKVNAEKMSKELKEEIDNPDFTEVTRKEATNELAFQAFANTNLRALAEKPNLGEKNATDQSNNFTPLGVLVCHWTELFPWLTIAIDNRIGNLKKAKCILRWRTMIQDFQALSLTYYAAHASSIVIPTVSAIQLGDAFAQGATILRETIEEDEEGEVYEKKMKDAFKKLAPAAQTIYQIWTEKPFLRKAELGMGVVFNGKESIGEITTFGNEKGYRGAVFSQVPCAFDNQSAKNYSVFADVHKVLPIIMPDGAIRAFCEFGYLGTEFIVLNPKGGAKESHTRPAMDRAIEIIRNDEGKTSKFFAHTFQSDVENKYLINKEKSIELFSIPLEAAKGITWKGASNGSATIGSSEDLKNNILAVEKELTNLSKYTFTGDNYKTGTDLSTIALSEINVTEHYIGIIPQQKDVINLFTNA